MEVQKKEKREDEMFCKSCGSIIKKEAEICVHCGVRVNPSQTQVVVQPVPKDKAVAVLLAVFLGFWTWCYTYKKDAPKFWVNLGLSVVTFGIWGIAAWVWAIIDTAIKPDTYYTNFPN